MHRTALRTLPLLGFLLFDQSSCHTWNEQFSLIGSDGKYTGAYGYSRGYVGRTDPGYNGDSMTYLLPSLQSGRTRINSSDLLCHPAQRQPVQSPNYPRLEVAPGSAVAMKYLENGHVTLPQNQPGKPPLGGTAFVFGTTSPQADEKIATVLQWNKDGTGGDGRGRLLAANNFDDGRCHQINSGPISMERQQTDPDPFPGQPTSVSEQWCETDLILPSDLAVGKTLAIYWVWQWPTTPGAPGLPDGKDEYYTTCSDFDVVAKEPDGPITNTLVIQDPQTLAVSDYKSRPAITPVPDLRFDPIGSGSNLATTSTTVSAPSLNGNVASPTIPTLTTFTMPPVTSVPPAVPTTSPVGSSVPLALSSPVYTPPVSPVYTPPVPAASSTSLTSSYIPAAISSPVYTSPIPAMPTSVPPPVAPSVPATFSSAGIPASSPYLPSPVAGTPSMVVMTALITVTATLAPTQSMLIVQGSHVITFSNPQMTVVPRDQGSRNRGGRAEVHRRRAPVHVLG